MSGDAVAAKFIADLREKLLDLTTGNKLLSYKHAERSRSYVRGVDIPPNGLVDAIQSGRQIFFDPLPEPENVLPDEYGEDFLLALEAERRIDPAWVNLREEEEDVASDRTAKLDRTIRDRVRAALGMSPTKSGRMVSAADWARLHNIEPDFDLPASEGEEEQIARIQTLLMPDELQSKMAGVLDQARTCMQEMGVNILHFAVGFLEWYESPSSDKALLAPLLLYPCDLERKAQKARGKYNYFLKGSEEAPIINITLKKRLERDFGMLLPDYEEEDTPETYFERVASILSGQKRWRVRRYATLGLFGFSRLVMYNDLAPEKWGGDLELADAGILDDLFGAKDGAGVGAQVEHNLDSPEIEREVPLLIRDADSSQHRAIIDVMRGANLVIKGPPGTGKSQTISNIIAAALAADKTVLFLAEKPAALNVVKNRLDDAGLGHFCFELHSTKSAHKQDVIDSLDGRLNFKAPKGSMSVSGALEELNRLRERLANHSVVMNEPFGALEIFRRGRWEKASVHDILWMEQRTRIVPPVIDEIDHVMFEDCETVNRATADRRRDLLTKIESLYGQFEKAFGSPANHPWRMVTSTSIGALDVSPVVTKVSATAAALYRLEEWLAVGAAPFQRSDLPGTLKELEAVSKCLADIPDLALSLDDAMLRVAVQSHNAGDRLLSVASAIEKFRQADERLRQRMPDATGSLDRAKLAAAVETTKRHDVAGVSLTDISRKIEQDRKEAATWALTAGFAKQVLEAIGLAGHAISPKAIRRALDAIDLFAETGRTALVARIPSVLEETARPHLERAVERIRTLRQRDETLRQHFFLDATVTSIEIRRHAGTLKATGFFAKMSGEYKAAKKVFDSIAKVAPDGERTMAAMLLELAEHLEHRTSFDNDQTLRSLCAHRFAGLDTDAEALLAANQWADKVRKQFAGVSEPERSIRRLIIDADMDTVDALIALRDDPNIAHLRAALEEQAAPEHTDIAQRAVELATKADEMARALADLTALGFVPEINPNEAAEIPAALDALDEAKKVIDSNDVASHLGPSWRGIDTDITALRAAAEAGRALHGGNTPAFILGLITASNGTTIAANVTGLKAVGQELWRCCAEAADMVRGAFEQLLEADEVEWEVGKLRSGTTISSLAETLANAAAHRDELMHWASWRKLLADARGDGLQELLDTYGKTDAPLIDLIASFDRVLHRSLVRKISAKFPGLLETHGLSMAEVRKQFSDLDKRIMDMQRQKLIADLAERAIPAGVQSVRSKDCTDLALVKNEISRSRHIPTRALLDRAWDAIIEMKPCFMMSPLSVAQYLTPDMTFDLVVIDEASQMLPEDSLGALARADQTVVVGDPQQLPPSGFFRGFQDTEDDEEKIDSKAMASILDLARAVFHQRELLWHYRSKHGSLIAFSNRHFYDDRLFVFPSPQEDHPDHGVKLIPIEGKFKAKVNIPEAQSIVAAALDFMIRHPDKSLGIVALNQPQRDLIFNDMERLFIHDPRAARYYAKWVGTLDYFFVKNLENVQGDERDVIFISGTYAPDENGNLDGRMFGPINGAAGGRRLNVLFSRAKHGVTIFSSLSPEQIKVNGDGTRLLKAYLEFAATRRLDSGHSLSSECDSDFEVFVKERVEGLGFQVDAQVGVAGYRIDLGLKHPEWPYGYLIGIECDGAAYHSSLSARDRDRLRQSILEGLGWRLYRIWSTDWFHDQNREVVKLLDFVEAELKTQLTAQRSAAQVVVPVANAPDDDEVVFPEKAEPAADVDQGHGGNGKSHERSDRYQEVDLAEAGFVPNPALIDDEIYEDVLVSMIRHIVNVEGPIRDDVLARRIAINGHGFKRTGPAMKANIVRLARRFLKSTEEDVGRFFWPEDVTPEEWTLFRQPDENTEPRAIEEISAQELRALILAAQKAAGRREDPWKVMARLAGVQRLRAPSRERLTNVADGLLDGGGEEDEIGPIELSTGCYLGDGAVLEQDEEIHCHLHRRDLDREEPDGIAVARDGGLYVNGERVEPQRKNAWLQAALRIVQQQVGDVSEMTGDAKSLNAWLCWFVRRNGAWIRLADLRTHVSKRTRGNGSGDQFTELTLEDLDL